MMNTSQGSNDHDVIGTYRILRLLGRGGMGDVYLAWSGLRLVAVKILNAQHAGDHEFVQMFLSEARVAARINHTGIAQVLDVGMDAGRLYMVMEYVAGHTLDELLRDPSIPGLLPLRITASMFAFVAHALGAAHRGRVVHRDISPHNLLISDTGAVKLIDFGIARTQNGDVHTTPGTFRGRFGYMAPEYIQSLPCDHRVDLFALGVVMWETFARQRLYVGTAAAQMFAMIERAAERLDELIPGFPIELADVVAKLLQRDPELRYRNAEDVANDLDALAPKLPDDGFRNLEHWVTHHLSARIEARALTDREQLQRIAGVEAVNRLTMDLRRPANQFSLPSPTGELAAGTLDTELDGEVTAIEGPVSRSKERDKTAIPERIAQAERSVKMMRMMSTEKIQRIELEELDDEPSGHGERSVEADALPASIVDAVSGATYVLSIPGAGRAPRAASASGWAQLFSEQRRGLMLVAALSAVVVVLSLMLGFRGEMRARKGEWRARRAQQEAAQLAAKEREAEAALEQRRAPRAAAGTAGMPSGIAATERTAGAPTAAGSDATSGAGVVAPAPADDELEIYENATPDAPRTGRGWRHESRGRKNAVRADEAKRDEQMAAGNPSNAANSATSNAAPSAPDSTVAASAAAGTSPPGEPHLAAPADPTTRSTAPAAGSTVATAPATKPVPAIAAPAAPASSPTPRVPDGMSGDEGRGAAAVGRCNACHGQMKAGAVEGKQMTRSQWERFFRNGSHDRALPLGGRVSVGELAAAKAFLMTRALDASTIDQGAGIR